jgi:hypothetical protein
MQKDNKVNYYQIPRSEMVQLFKQCAARIKDMLSGATNEDASILIDKLDRTDIT